MLTFGLASAQLQKYHSFSRSSTISAGVMTKLFCGKCLMFPVTRNDPSLDRVNQVLAEREFLAGQHIPVLFDYLVVVQRYDSVFGRFSTSL